MTCRRKGNISQGISNLLMLGRRKPLIKYNQYRKGLNFGNCALQDFHDINVDRFTFCGFGLTAMTPKLYRIIMTLTLILTLTLT